MFFPPGVKSGHGRTPLFRRFFWGVMGGWKIPGRLEVKGRARVPAGIDSECQRRESRKAPGVIVDFAGRVSFFASIFRNLSCHSSRLDFILAD